MDALLANIQLAETVYIETNSHQTLRRLESRNQLTERIPIRRYESYVFQFDASARRLAMGNQDFALGIDNIKIERTGSDFLQIIIFAEEDAEAGLETILTGSVDIRYKHVDMVTRN
jgi:hypothetical protein